LIISINQPAFIPWLGYFQRILLSDLHVVLDHVQFEKNSMINRNKIKTKDGKELWLTIPVKTSGRFGDLSINKIEIHNNRKWQKRITESIKHSYGKSPFFNEYYKDLELMICDDYLLLNDIIKRISKYLISQLQINIPIYYSTDLAIRNEKSELILELCKYFKADTYISGPFGRNYLEIEKFESAKIKLLFHDYNHPTYKQINGGFISHLSILDLLFNKGPESKLILQNIK